MTDAAAEATRYDLRLVPAAVTGWVITAAGVLWPVGVPMTALCAVIAVGAAVASRCLTSRAVSLAVLAAAAVGVGFGIAVTMRDNAIRDHPVTQSMGRQVEATVLVTESPRVVGGSRMLIRADLRLLNDRNIRGRIIIFASVRDFGEVTAGQSVRLRARIGPPTRRDLTLAVFTATGRPTIGPATAVQRGAQALRSRLAELAREVLPPDQAALLPALALGDTSGLSPVLVKDFRTSGLTHLTAVSGANVTIVCGAVLLSAVLVGPRIAVALAAVVLVAFVVVVQPTASVLRAAVMGAIALVAIVSSRRRQAIPALAATVIGLLAVAPQLAVDIGFLLSVSATAALVVLAPIWSQRLVGHGWPKPVADAVCVATAAQLVTAPLVAGISGAFSVVAVVANVLVAPVIAPITVLGTTAAAVCLVMPGVGALLVRFSGPELWWLLSVSQWSAGIPHAAVPVPSGFAGAAVVAAATVGTVLLWRLLSTRIALAALVICLLAWLISGCTDGRLTGLSAGHGTIIE
ncbi:MAG: ComEC/Rec2 family competence protein [Mycobacterium sp.]